MATPGCPSGIPLCSIGCHATCSSPAFRSGSSYVPQPAKSSFVLPHYMVPCSQEHCGQRRKSVVCSLGLLPLVRPHSFQQASVHSLPILLCSPCLPSPAFRGLGGTNPRLCRQSTLQWIGKVLNWRHATLGPFTVRPSPARAGFTGRPSRWRSPADLRSVVPPSLRPPP